MPSTPRQSDFATASVENKHKRQLMPTLLNLSTIKSRLSTPSLRNIPIDYYPQIDSTNTQLKRESSKRLPRICLAEEQTNGRGQTDKQWHSPPAQNIYLSFAFSHTQQLQQLEGFSLVTGIATIKALAAFNFQYSLKIKWPNDIYYQDKKLGGILIETATHSTQPTHVVVGIGLNANITKAEKDCIDQPWTSLALISGEAQNRNTLISLIIEQFFSHLTLFEQAGLPPFLDQWEQYDILRGKEVTLENAYGSHNGIAAGVNARGQLLIKTPNGVSAHTSGNLKWETD